MNPSTYEYQTELFRRPFLEGKAQGEAKGKANGVLLVLAARGIEVSEPVRERVNACTDIPTLNTWIGRTATASSAEELFD